MSTRRDSRDGAGVADLGVDAGVVPEPGRRPLTAPHDHRSIPSSPGKRTVTQGLRFDVSAAFEPCASECRQHLERLAVAIDQRDFTAAFASAASVRRTLETLRESIHAGGGGTEGPTQLNELELRARPLLAQAPVVSDDAYRERFYSRIGAPHPLWDAAEASWTGSKNARSGRMSSGSSFPRGSADLESAVGMPLGHVGFHDEERGHATAAAHGARAVTIGSDIFMGAGQPGTNTREGRELVAHEVAHVVQAAGAVNPRAAAKKNDQSTDTAEVEADQFASTFVARGGAMNWLPNVGVASGTPMRSPSSAAAGAARQAVADKPDVAFVYLRTNQGAFLAAIEERLKLVGPPANDRLTWAPNGTSARFRTALSVALGNDPLFIKLPELVHPADPWYSIDLHRLLTDGTAGVTIDGRDPVGPMSWNYLAGEAIATDVQVALTASLKRMVSRFLVQVDEKHPKPVTIADLVASHPMDRLTAALLCDDQVLKAKPSSKKQPKGHGEHAQPNDPRLFKDGVRFLQNYRWLGSTDPKLWNWIEVVEPRNATVEEVAATLWLDPDASQYAYGITASGPYFRIEPKWARRFSPDAKYAPDEKHDDNALDLADSTIASEAAIAQAAGEKRVDKRGHALPADYKALTQTLERSARQIDRAKQLLGGNTQLWELVLPALHWVARYRDGLAGVSDERMADLTPVIEGQSHILFEAVGALTEITGMGDPKALQGTNSPVLDVMRDYAIVVGESHLIESARVHLGRARKAKADLPLALLEMSANDTQTAVKEFVAQGHGDWGGDDANLIDIDRRRIADMRRKQAAGQNVDPSAVVYVAASAKDRAVDVRTKTLYGQLMDLINYARDSKFGFFEALSSIPDPDIRSLPGQLMEILTDLNDSVIVPHGQAKETALKGLTDEAARATALGNVTRQTEQAFAAFLAKWNLKERMAKALAIIEKQQRRTAVIRIITQIVILIGASVVGGIAGNMVAGAVRGALIADAATASVGMVRAANVAGTIAGLTVDATINAGSQLAVQGGDWKEAFVGNFLASSAIRVALTPINRAAQAWGAASEDLKNLSAWEKVGRGGKIVLREGAVLTTSMITATATDYVVQRIYHSNEPPTEKEAVDWAIQGGSMAVGSFVGRWAHGFESHLVQYAENKGQLLARARKIQKLSAEVEKLGNEQAALELLMERQEALQEEAKLIDQLSKKPAASHMQPSTLEALRIGNQKESGAVQDAAFATVPMRLAGLTPDDASGLVWTGHRAQIDSAMEQSRRAGITVEVKNHDAATGRWQVFYNHQEITIIETKVKSRVILAGDDTRLRDAAANIKPIAGWRDVALHGNVDEFEVLINGKTVPMDHRALATWLHKQGAGNERIRLLSCETGKHPKGAAQHLANKLGVEVMAPNDFLHVFEDGSMVIGPTDQRNTGSWEVFKPQKSSRRFSQPKEPAPERAIDRFHRTRADETGSTTLGDDSVEKPTLHGKTDLGDARVRGQDYAEKAGSRVGGNLELTVKDVAFASAASDVQVEAGLRVLDGVFGKHTSDEFKRVAKSINAANDSAQKEQDEQMFEHVDRDRERIGKDMLDVLRNPALDIATRKTQLKTKLDELEAAVKSFSKLDASKIPFAEARRQIEALRADTFEDMISVDAAGNLSQKGQRIGTLRDLMNKVQATNAAFRRHGVEQEFVIAVSTPLDPSIPREVKILSRAPRDTSAAAAKGKHAPVDPSNQAEDGVVVDIGVGTSDYARDVGGETGQVVKTEYGQGYADPAMLRRDLTWEHTGTRVDVDSVLVLGDALQTLPMMFADRSVKRLFINNINAHYVEGSEQYRALARGLRKVMKPGGRVEVQWATASETTGGETKPRGHITGDALREAFAKTANDIPRPVRDAEASPVTDYDYSVQAPRPKSGIPSKQPPTSPVPEKRWIFTFGD